jgi:hypothetical protein
MSKLSLTKPQKLEDCEEWIVYIVKEGLFTGIAGRGNSPKEATRAAQAKIEKGEGEIKD